MSGRLLLDTCALLWIGQGEEISAEARSALDRSWRDGFSPAISPMTAWELSLLAARGRLSLTSPVAKWWERACAELHLEVCALSPASLMQSHQLPGEPHRDPADRILIATAREFGLNLLTRDRKILDYAAAGHVMALSC